MCHTPSCGVPYEYPTATRVGSPTARAIAANADANCSQYPCLSTNRKSSSVLIECEPRDLVVVDEAAVVVQVSQRSRRACSHGVVAVAVMRRGEAGDVLREVRSAAPDSARRRDRTGGDASFSMSLNTGDFRGHLVTEVADLAVRLQVDGRGAVDHERVLEVDLDRVVRGRQPVRIRVADVELLHQLLGVARLGAAARGRRRVHPCPRASRACRRTCRAR